MSSAEHRHAKRFYGAVAAIVLCVVLVVLLRRPRTSSGHDRPPPRDLERLAWCAEGTEPIAGEGCFASPASPRGLLVYLHGRYGPEGVKDELERQARVVRLSSARGFAVLALRGAQGQCSDPLLASWWCWPSNERNAGDGPAFVARWAVALEASERRLGPQRRVLLGFSNGGYFAALIASRALERFDAVAIAHAGPVAPMRPLGARPPMLLLDADDDPSGPEMDRLGADLQREEWPLMVTVREGAHALLEWDIETALAFFERTRTETLPLVPPLAARTRRAPTPVVPEAGAETDATADSGD
jgi:predicted esterase